MVSQYIVWSSDYRLKPPAFCHIDLIDHTITLVVEHERKKNVRPSLVPVVGAVSAEELNEKYKKLFQEFSKIKAQHSILKKAVLKEQARNTELTEQVKVKEQDLRNSIQQLDLLTFHNQRLTKRIESLQDANKARLTPGWLVGSAKKELEKSKSTLETTSVELGRKIEENEMLNHKLYEYKSLYAQETSALQTRIADLEKKNEELEVELSRSNIAGDEAMDTLREEKQQLEMELEETKTKLKEKMEKLSVELGRKIEENEMLTRKLHESQSLYAQDLNALKTRLADLEKKNEELEVELSRSNIAGGEAMDTLREEKQQLVMELETELEETKKTLKETMEKLKESESARKNAISSPEPAKSQSLSNVTAPESETEKHNTSALLTRGGPNTLEKDAGRVEISDGDATRELLIKKHYESKIQQLNERLQLADSTSVRMAEAVKLMREKLATAEKEITRLQAENKKCKEDLGRVVAEKIEADGSHKKEKDIMTDYINELQKQLQTTVNLNS
ncbi:8379_t:CDS:10 [Paraglomus occultum]|uniref:8379_t:CDS:1 n=1 Tax=Paraglomus occultum TaxID=144539 RepID=A0A9N8ZS17_9GLOM|nr:8379_t:CDS:10 [Paraglomus occultum]